MPVPAIVLNAETPAAGAKSIAVALQSRLPNAPLKPVAVQLECPLGLGAGVFQIQDSDVDTDADFTSIAFGGAQPGQITIASVNANGVARVELVLQARFLRILCVTAPGNPVTIRVG
jgi:hypothetical protein